MKKFVLLCTTALLPSAVYAQSTGTVETENREIVITGSKARSVGGVQTPNTPKAKVVLTQEMIARQGAGQSILDTINLVPGVSFQNNDAYGSAGGTLTIRGFDSPLPRDFVWRAQEQHINPAFLHGVPRERINRKGAVAVSRELRVELGHIRRGTVALAPQQDRFLHAGMREQQASQLEAGIPGCTDDRGL